MPGQDSSCNTAGCTGPVHARGLCNRCYQRRRRERMGGGCAVADCERGVYARGWCHKHYKRWRMAGEIVDVERLTLAERFWPNVARRGDGCWIWTGSKTSHGYGQISVVGFPRGTHRVAWELTYGEIPRGLYVLHSCDVRACVRPTHLFLGTHLDNIADMVAKRRHRPRGRSQK